MTTLWIADTNRQNYVFGEGRARSILFVPHFQAPTQILGRVYTHTLRGNWERKRHATYHVIGYGSRIPQRHDTAPHPPEYTEGELPVCKVCVGP